VEPEDPQRDSLPRLDLPGSVVLEPDGRVVPAHEASPRTASGDQPTAAEVPRYEIRGEHGRGGQARVLLAYDLLLGREIAWKEMLENPGAATSQPGVTQSSQAARFVREACVTGQLEHPNIVPVYELGISPEGRPYYTMRLVRGRTLAKALRAASGLRERLRLLEHFLGLCQAIAFAHSRGVIHRDLKPDNVMVGEFGETVVLDWGLAKVQGAEDTRASDLGRRVEKLQASRTSDTIEGSALGTPSYMSPEQADGRIEEIDERSDVWGLGAVLFELLTGRPPFVGETPYEIIGRVISRPVPEVRALAPDAPRELAAVAMKALTRERAGRYASARELAAEVSAYLTGGRVQAYAYTAWELVKRFATRHKFAATAAVLALAVVLAALGLVTSAYRTAERARLEEHAERLRASHNLAQAYAEKADRFMAETDFAAGRVFAAAAGVHNPARAGSPLHDPAFAAANPASQRLLVLTRSQLYRAGHALRGELRFAARDAESMSGLAVSPDGQVLAVAVEDGSVGLWDARSGARLGRLPASRSKCFCVAFSADGHLLAAGGDGSEVRLWRMPGAVQVGALPHVAAVTSLAFAPDGATLATGDKSGLIRLWDLPPRPAPRRELAAHEDLVAALDYSPDGLRLASASWDKTVKLWAPDTGQELRTFRGHTDAVSDVAFAPRERLVASTGWDKQLLLWDPADGQIRLGLSDHADTLLGVAFRPDGDEVAVAGFDRSLLLYDAHTGKRQARLSGHTDSVRALGYLEGGHALASASYDHSLRVWDLRAERLAPALQGHTDWVYQVDFSPDGRGLVSASWDRSVGVWDLATGVRRLALRGHAGGLYTARFSPDGRRIASGDQRGELRVWDAADGRLLYSRQAHDDWIYKVAFSPDSRRLATVSRDRTVRIADAASGEAELVLRGHENFVYVCEWTADGQRLATTSADRTVRLWDTTRGTELMVLRGHRDWVSGLAFFDRDRRLASSAKDGRILLWDLSSGKAEQELAWHRQWVNNLSVSPDGRWLASAGDDSRVVLWSLPQGEAVLELQTDSSVTGVAFSPDSRTLAVGDRYDIRLYPLDFGGAEEASPAELLRQAELAAGRSLDGFELRPLQGP